MIGRTFIFLFSLPIIGITFFLHFVRMGSKLALIAIAVVGYFTVELFGYGWLKITYWAIVIISVVVRYKSAMDRHAAALNVVLAKHTFHSLSSHDQHRVHEHALDIIRRSGGRQQEFSNETSQYGWYALAMAELEIPPAVSGGPAWCYVRNPNLAVFADDPWMNQVIQMCKRRFHINVEISHQDKTLDLIAQRGQKTPHN